MSPLEKVRARAAALEVLGVSHHANQDEIRTAWRRLAFESHPDRNDGAHVDFERVRAAYDFLQGGPVPVAVPDKPVATEDAPAPAPSRPKVPRPSLTKRVEDLGEEIQDACQSVLKEDERIAAGMAAANSAAADDAPQTVEAEARARPFKDHVPASFSRLGRSLTFRVNNPLRKGINRVAMPTTVLAHDKAPNPRILSFFSHDDGAGVIHVPDSVAREMFPGAKSVRLRFVGGQIERPITALKAS